MSRLIAVDTETHLIKPGLQAPPLVCVSWAEGGYVGLYDREQGIEMVRGWLREVDTHLVFHNAPFDMAVLCAADSSLIPLAFQAYADGRIWDTRVREELMDIREGRKQEGAYIMVYHNGVSRQANYALAGLAERYLGKDRWGQKKAPDAWRLRYAELDGVPLTEWPVEAADYAKEDASDTLRIFWQQGGPDGALPTEQVHIQSAWALHLMSCWGLRTDADRVNSLEATLLAEQKENRNTLIREKVLVPEKCTKAEVDDGGVDFYVEELKKRLVAKKNMVEKPGVMYSLEEDGRWREVWMEKVPYRWKKDTKRIEALVAEAYRALGEEPPLTKTGRIATDKDACYRTGDELLKLIADGGGVDKLLGTYIPVLKQGTEYPINARFNVLVNSGRTSCSKPNLQNLPAGRRAGQGEVRTCFVPREGWVFSSTDYGTLELCALAEVCLEILGQSRMAEVINAGRDLHTQMAADMLGVSYEQVAAHCKTPGTPEKKARDAAKVGNFGLPGGLGAQSLVDYARDGYGLILEFLEARRLIADWRAGWPEMTGFFKYINDRVGFGEAQLTHPITGFIRGGVGYCDGCNNLFQHLAAYGAKKALFAVAWECYVDLDTPLFGSRPVVFVHDEIIAEHPEEMADAAAKRLAFLMVQEMSTVITRVRIKATPALMRSWQKNATDVYNEDGGLIPWEDRSEAI